MWDSGKMGALICIEKVPGVQWKCGTVNLLSRHWGGNCRAESNMNVGSPKKCAHSETTVSTLNGKWKCIILLNIFYIALSYILLINFINVDFSVFTISFSKWLLLKQTNMTFQIIHVCRVNIENNTKKLVQFLVTK